MIEEAAGGLTGTGGCIRLVGVGGGEVDVEGWGGSGEVIVHRPGSHVFFTARAVFKSVSLQTLWKKIKLQQRKILQPLISHRKLSRRPPWTISSTNTCATTWENVRNDDMLKLPKHIKVVCLL